MERADGRIVCPAQRQPLAHRTILRMPPSELPGIAATPAAAPELPVHLTSLVGRERELADLVRLVGTPRLLTLTGAGGSGKTRLARATAERVAASFERVAWVDLSLLDDAQFLVPQVAAVLGAPERTGVAPLEVVVSAIGPARLLLVLDNCEHVVDACADAPQARRIHRGWRGAAG